MLTPYDLYKEATRYVTFDPGKSETVLYADHLHRNPDEAMTFEDFTKTMRDMEYRRLSTSNRVSDLAMKGITNAAMLGVAAHGLYQSAKGRPAHTHMPMIAAIMAAQGMSNRYHSTGNAEMQYGWDRAMQRSKSASALSLFRGR